MKYIIAFLFLCASTVFGAVPSFQAFDANFFQITGTGNNSIKIKTNNFTWGGISGGTGDSVWTNSAGTLRPVSTNKVNFSPTGSSLFGDASILPLATATLTITPTGDGFVNWALNATDDNYTLHESSAVFVQQGSGAQSSLTLYSTINGYTNYPTAILFSGNGEAYLTLDDNGTIYTSVKPFAADGTTPYTFDTRVRHEPASGSLVDFLNNATNRAFQVWPGGLLFGEATADLIGDPHGALEGYLLSARSPDYGDEGRAGLYLFGTDGFGGDMSLRLDLLPNQGQWRLRGDVFSTTRIDLNPTAGAAVTPYIFDTDVAHSSGNLLEVKNNSTNKFAVTWNGTVNIDQANIGSATFTNVYFLNPIIGSNGVASYAANAPVAITASGWTNSYSVNAIAEIDAAAADLKYFIKNSAGTGVYTNLASSTVWHATAILQPGGAVVITAGTTPSGTARPF